MLKKIYLYLSLNLLKSTLVTLLVLFAIIFAIEYIDLTRRFSSIVTGQMQLLKIIIIHIFTYITVIMPFAVLIGSIAALIRLNLNNELSSFRTFGLSVFNIEAAVFITFFLLGFTYLLAIAPITTYCHKKYEQFLSKVYDREASFLLSSSGLWLYDNAAQSTDTIINAARIGLGGRKIFNLDIYSYNPAEKSVTVISAVEAHIETDKWVLHKAHSINSALEETYHETYELPINVDFTELQRRMDLPQTIQWWRLPKVIRLAKKSGFATTDYELYYYKLLALPLIFAAIGSFGATFTFAARKEGALFKNCLIGIFVGFAIYFFNNVFHAFADRTNLPLGVVVFMPYVMVILFTIYHAIRIEER